MTESIRTVFEDECAGLVIDTKLAKRILNYEQNFVQKNENHIAFFGGNLLGVQVVRFNSSDRDRWFDEILEVEPDYLEHRLLSLPTVNENWNISSDTMNLSCAWLLHALYVSKIPEKEKHAAMIAVAQVLQYRYITSLLFHFFKYPAEKSLAEATYAQLSYKFAIKQHGSWGEVLRVRAEDVCSNDSIHVRTIRQMDADADVTYLLNDMQGRIRGMMKKVYSVFMQTKNTKSRISTTSQVVEHDGEAILKDKSKNLLAYGRYLNSVITDKPSFVREELTTVIEQLMYTMPPKAFHQTLEYMSNNYRQARAGDIEAVLNETLVHSFEYLAANRKEIRNERDLPTILSKLRGVYMSSRSTDQALFSLRAKTEKIIRDATGNKNDSAVASVRTGVLLYLVARAFTMHHYTTGAM